MPANDVPAISLDNVPNEILEHIAFFSGTSPLLGPPSTIPTLLTLNRNINSVLSPSRNPHVYARIFAAKFDTSALFRRFGAAEISAQTLAKLLKERCTILKRVRTRTDCLRGRAAFAVDEPARGTEEGMLDEILLTCYKMMLENDGRNEQQLRHFGLYQWLDKYLFDLEGASFAIMALRAARWPESDDRLALAMWLFWFTLDSNRIIYDNNKLRSVMSVLKPFALGAHRYHLSRHPWTSFTPPRPPTHSSGHFIHTQSHHHLSHSTTDKERLAPLPLSVPAILCYFNLASARMAGGSDPYELLGAQFSQALADNRMGGWGATPVPAILPRAVVGPSVPNSVRWDSDWTRCVTQELAGGDFGGDERTRGVGPYHTFKPGCLEGAWEGLFTYTEFTTYAALLEGASPQALQSSRIAQHRQTWKIREHHLLADLPPFTSAAKPAPSYSIDPSQQSPSSPPFNSASSAPPRLPGGDPLRGYLPSDITITESTDGIDVTLPDKITVLHYKHFTSESAKAHERASAEGGIDYSSRVKDIILTGEGHSSWGEFSLIGRVRPYDGFINVSKEYVNGDRGRWLYKGYLVGVGTFNGMQAGHMVGRWRDTLTPFEMPGYEGCFGMTRRQ